MRQLTIIPDTVRHLPSHLLRAEEDSLLPHPLQPHFGQFEYLPTDSSRLFFAADHRMDTSFQVISRLYPGDPMPFSSSLQSLFFLLFLFFLLLFAVLFRKEGASFAGNFRNIFSMGKPALLMRKEQVTSTEAWGELFLVVQTMLVAGMLIFHLLWEKGIYAFTTSEQLMAFGLITAVISLLTGMKILSYRAIALFFLREDMRIWVTQYARMIELIGLILFLPALCFLFLPEWKEGLLMLFALLFLFSRLVIIIKLLHIFVKNKIGWFYFFVYLCGTEIAPWLLLYKGLLSISEIAGMN
ncbi:MAG: DUF4271 domain-containing protein [bacterium]|nr:DUF4271 domain-containing protein [bacterium]MDD3624335.1 DUF4271 domain-containing protein [Proteiniphilum sp.]MDD3967215.1 DUF4271 domain-containing protein [Proteiniphilum sp.]MDD4458457.1 DUF4271 domain-containing protein [Proteiniphilum sp.]